MNQLHRRPLELAAAAIDFDLSPQERTELDEHVEGCLACRRRVAGLRQDALTMTSLPLLPVAPTVSARLRAATVARNWGSPGASSLRLVGVAAILALLALGALAVGASLLDRDPVDLSVVPTDPTNAPARLPTPTPSPATPSATPTPSEPVAYEPPAPSCPAPPEEVPPPDVDAIVGIGDSFAPTVTADLVTTCSTSATGDYAGIEPETAHSARAGEPIRFFLDSGWHVLHWEGFDRDRDVEGSNVILGETPEGRPSFLSVPVPDRTGNVILGVTIWAMTTDGRAVANVSASVWLDVEPAGPAALHIIPADTACDSVAWPEGVAPYGEITFVIDPSAAELVTAVSDTGASLLTLWPEGFRAGPAADRTVLSPDGQAVATNGQVIAVPATSLPRLGGYDICLTPSSLHVVLAPSVQDVPRVQAATYRPSSPPEVSA